MQYLKRLYTDSATTVTTATCSIPEFLSPIQDYSAKNHGSNGGVKFASEAEVHTLRNVIALYPKTPHPGVLKSPPLSSTPLVVESEPTQSSIFTCSPRALNFEDSSQPSNVNDIRNASEPTVNGSCKIKASPTEGTQAHKEECNNNIVVVSPGLPEDEDLRTESNNSSKLDNLHSDLSMSLNELCNSLTPTLPFSQPWPIGLDEGALLWTFRIMNQVCKGMYIKQTHGYTTIFVLLQEASKGRPLYVREYWISTNW